jgi:hypothetical protein
MEKPKPGSDEAVEPTPIYDELVGLVGRRREEELVAATSGS